MRSKSKWMIGSAVLAVTVMALSPVVHAATIFDVNFDGTNETLGDPPDTQAASALPTLNSVPSSTAGGVTIEDATSKTNFNGFGSGNFAYFATSGANNRLNFVPNGSDLHNSGTYTFTFDYRRDSGITSQTGSFTASFWSSNNTDALGYIYVSNTTGSLTIYRLVNGVLESAGVNNFNALAADANYTIKGELFMDGANSTVNFYAAETDGTFQQLDNGKSDAITLGDLSLADVRFLVTKNKTVGLGVDNMTVEYNAIPEPASGAVLLMAGLGMLGARRRRK